MVLSYSFQRRETTGFVKGTKSSDMSECIDDLLRCSGEIVHPLLLPNTMMSHLVSDKDEQKQRDARGWIRRIEHMITSHIRDDLRVSSENSDPSTFDLKAIASDPTECVVEHFDTTCFFADVFALCQVVFEHDFFHGC
ncbi:hypothetical protein LZ30DRAFT_724007 [Colletotrichum cereale]|nr:hypothetical protein LZ30DRAFT_724007 [Colletotrichum cereale]